jgi:hypothetical protein
VWIFRGAVEQVDDVVVGGEFGQLPRSLVAAVSGVDIGPVDDQDVDHVDFAVRGGEIAWLPCHACLSCAFNPPTNSMFDPRFGLNVAAFLQD